MDKKKTILYVGGFELPDKNAAAHRVINNARVLNSLGYNVVFCGIDKELSEKSNVPLNVYGFDSFPLCYSRNNIGLLKQVFVFKPYISLIKKYNPEIIIAYNMHARQLKKLICICKRNNIKIVGDITEWYDNRFSLNPIKFLKWMDTRKTMNKLNKKLDGIIAISTYLYNFYENEVKAIIKLPPLVNIDDDIWHQNISRCDKTKIVYSGNPGKTKDRLNEIIRVLSNIESDYIFTIIGITKEQYLLLYPNDVDIITRISNKIVFMGRVSHKESIKQLLESNLTIIIRENTRKNNAGFPTKFVESMTANTLTICNNFSNLKDYDYLDNCQIIENLDSTVIKEYFDHEKKAVLNSHFDYRNYIEVMNSFIKCLKE